MNTEEAVLAFPSLSAVVGADWMRTHPGWFEGPDMPLPMWFEQLERDLAALSEKVAQAESLGGYRPMLRDEAGFLKALLEAHGAALLARSSTQLGLHVPRTGYDGRNFDVQATIAGFTVNAECKTRADRFPFNFPKTRTEDGFALYEAGRAVLDPHDAERLGMPPPAVQGEERYIAIPEGTTIRRLLGDALRQLPADGINLVLFGHLQGDRADLERALFGAEVVDFIRDHRTKRVTTETPRVGTAAFEGEGAEEFRSLSGVLWFRVSQLDSLHRAYKLYPNQLATTPLPAEVVAALEGQFRVLETDATH